MCKIHKAVEAYLETRRMARAGAVLRCESGARADQTRYGAQPERSMSWAYAFLAFLALLCVAVSGLGALLAPTLPVALAMGICAIMFFACMIWAGGKIDD